MIERHFNHGLKIKQPIMTRKTITALSIVILLIIYIIVVGSWWVEGSNELHASFMQIGK